MSGARSARLQDALDTLSGARAARESKVGATLFAVEDVDPDWMDPASASERWREDALDAIESTARAREYLTTAEVDWPNAPEVDPRARGAALVAASRAGLIEATSSYTSGGDSRHRRPVRVFRSNVYRGGAA